MGKRNKAAYKKLGHSELENFFRTKPPGAEKEKADNKLNEFLTEGLNKVVWLFHYLRHRFGFKAKYPKYTNGSTGVYKLNNDNHIPISIGLVFDWATDTPESDKIAKEITRHAPHYTIHGGDTYFVGDRNEIYENFLAPHSSWHRGSHGSFAIAGNHEMYSNGYAFFRDLLPSLGMRDNSGKYKGQEAGYFCLENDHWRILGLDTGYNAIGSIPVIEMLPWFTPDCHFHNDIIDWLINVVKLGDKNDKRGIVIITHHPYFTAFKGKSNTIAPAIQLASIIGEHRPVIWLWGHEHKLSLYARHKLEGGVTCYGRCMGNGGMPVELDAKHFEVDPDKSSFLKLVAYDHRASGEEENYNFGYNGYACLRLEEEKLTISYYDIQQLLFSETWQAANDGTIRGKISIPHSCPIHPMPAMVWEDAVN